MSKCVPSPRDRHSSRGRLEANILADSEVAEVPLFMHAGQLVALERAANRRGLTVGQLIRWLIRDCLAGENHAATEVFRCPDLEERAGHAVCQGG
jgi:hypothetical protein